MALINRIARLFRADFHAVLDQIEEPELLLRQAIRDMADELQRAGERIDMRVRREQELRSRIAEIESSAADADEQLDLCIRSGKDELAKGLVRKKLETERVQKRLRSILSENATSLDVERRQADEHRQLLDSLRQKAALFIDRPAANAGNLDESEWFPRDLCVSDDEVEIAFLHEKDSRTAS
jgi:phage shock protein A